ncbi:MAG: PAS domain S-box protein, partial [Gammaproteobacteria bacterium]|nr:PAS domain S-box protein [Gammaproteobacteria bacterium]
MKIAIASFNPYRLLPLLALLSGLSATWIFGDMVQQRSEASWQQQAEQESIQHSMALLNWIEESYAMLSGLTALVENSDSVDAGEFYNAVEGMESRARVNFMPTKALMTKQQSEWQVLYSSAFPEADANFPKEGTPPPMLLVETISGANDIPNEWMLSPPFDDSSGQRYLYVVIVPPFHLDQALVGVVNIDRMIDNLYDARNIVGLELEFRMTALGRDAPVMVSEREEGGVVRHQSKTLLYTAQANLELNWRVTDLFSGGVDRNVADIVRSSGSVLSVLIALYLFTLLRKNRQIQQRVDKATHELERAMEKVTVNETRLEKVLATSPIGVGVSVKGVLRMGNPALQEMLGTSIGMMMPDVYVNPQDRDRIMEILKRDGIARDLEVPMYNRQKERREYLATYLITDHGGEQGILCWLTDITERKQAE